MERVLAELLWVLGVSIPFREELHSDQRQLLGTLSKKRKVSIPFREELHSDGGLLCFKRSGLKIGFHPFQGRPPFGLTDVSDLEDLKA